MAWRNLHFRVGNAKRVKAKKRVKLFDYYLRKGGISSARTYICVKTVAERAKKELYIKSRGDSKVL